jgi:hypothetical protein
LIDSNETSDTGQKGKVGRERSMMMMAMMMGEHVGETRNEWKSGGLIEREKSGRKLEKQ